MGRRRQHTAQWRRIAFAATAATIISFPFPCAFVESDAWAQAPTAAELETAKRAFEDGVTLEKKGDYAGALGKFRESAQIKTTLGNRFHTAYCLEMTGKLAAALVEYEAVDKAAREQSKTDIIEQTRVRVEPLRPRVPQVMLRIVPPLPKDGLAGMEVLIDGSPIASQPFDGSKGSRVDPGEHVITAHAPDYENFMKKITIAEGATLPVDVVLERSGAGAKGSGPPPPPNGSSGGGTTEPPAEQPRAPSRTLAIATTAGAVVLAATGVAFFVVAGGAQSDAESTCPTKPSCDDERTKVRTFDALALGGFIGAVGLGALSVVLWVSKPSAAAHSQQPASRLVARPGFVGVEGRF